MVLTTSKATRPVFQSSQETVIFYNDNALKLRCDYPLFETWRFLHVAVEAYFLEQSNASAFCVD